MRDIPMSTVRFVGILLAFACTEVAAQGFVDVSAATGVSVPFNWNSQFGRGPCFGDFDRDGDQDLIIPGGPTLPIYHFRNDGNGTFTDVTGTTGLGMSTRCRACVCADIDNDGDLDVYVCNNWAPNQLFVNQGSGTFIEQAAQWGVDHAGGSHTASFGDYDRDGWIDLYVGNFEDLNSTPEANVLYRNGGNGTFTDVTAQAGVGDTGLCFTGIFHDYDDDGWPDLFVGNDRGYIPGFQPDTTYRNNGNGTFTDVGAAINTRFAIGAMGSDVVDVFNDGGWDIFVSNVSVGHLFHEWNPTTSIYDETAAANGIAAYVEGWAVNWLDYDNDGWQDLYITHVFLGNHLYRNPGTGMQGTPWTEVGVTLGADITGVKYSHAIGDYDDDGRIDIFQPRGFQDSVFLRNTVTAGNWLKVQTVGTRSNRDGIGAKISVTVNGVTQRQSVRTGTGYLGAADMRCHFGLGNAPHADRVEIWWPSGQLQVFENVAANQELLAEEPEVTLAGPLAAGSLNTMTVSVPGDGGLFAIMGLSLGTTPGLLLSDGRRLPVNADWLFMWTALPNNLLLPGSHGPLDAQGQASSPLFIPNLPSAAGIELHATAVTLDPAFSLGIRTILQPRSFTIQ